MLLRVHINGSVRTSAFSSVCETVVVISALFVFAIGEVEAL